MARILVPVVLVCILAAVSLQSDAAEAVSTAKCKGTPAIIAGNLVCLRTGINCKVSLQSQYRKYGFTCVSSKLRKAIANPRPKPSPQPPIVVPASVSVGQSGVSSRLTSIGSMFAGYGVVLRNPSPDEDALRVTVLVNLLAANGSIVDSDSTVIEGIPAGAEYYHGGHAIYNGAIPATKLEVSVQIGGHQAKRIGSLPPVTNVRWTENFLGTSVAGEFSNPYTQTLSRLARITFVCFRSDGSVVGGGYTYPPAAIPVGGRAGFSGSLEAVPVSSIASCQASIEPEVD